MSNQQPQSEQKPNPLARFIRWLWRFSIRLLFASLIGIGVGVAVYYYVLPGLYQNQIGDMQYDVAQLQAVATVQAIEGDQDDSRMESLQERLLSLEVFRDTNQQSTGNLEGQFADLADAQATQQASITGEVAALSAAQAEIASTITDLESAIAALEADISTLDESVTAMSTQTAETIASQAETLDVISQTISVQAAPIEALARDLQLLKAMELLTRSRLFFVQVNYGLATADVDAARTLVLELLATAPDPDVPMLSAVVGRLDAALANLPLAPTLAEADIELAWQLLVGGMPADDFLPEPEVVTDTVAEEPTQTPTPEITPTPVPSPTPTP